MDRHADPLNADAPAEVPMPSKKARLPSILLKPPKQKPSEAESKAAFNALLEHYNLTNIFEAVTDAGSLEDRREQEIVFYSKLASSLLRDFVPAFGKHGGRPTRFKKADVMDWIEAGGSGFTCPRDMTPFHQAQLVAVIQRLEAEKGQSREWVFRWLTEKKSGHEERRSLLPRLYRGRTTAKSLREAFNGIPKAVRDNPSSFLPTRREAKPSGPPTLLDEILAKLGLPPLPPPDDAGSRGLF